MKRVYIAGSYSSDNVMGVLENMRKGIRKGTEVLLKGYAPFVPWLDHHIYFQLREDEKLDIDNFYNYSLSWLSVADAVLVLPNYEKSKGTLNEITFANQLGIPVYYSLEELEMSLKGD